MAACVRSLSRRTCREAVGYEIWWAQTDAYAGKLLHLKAGECPFTSIATRPKMTPCHQ
jgi:hypothetical protein